MKVLSHRGYWKTVAEKNSPAAFERSFSMGFGTETDLRDLAGQLVVSHDPPLSGAMAADELLTLHQRHDATLPLALNIKADGLQQLLLNRLERLPQLDAFVFDMSIPDAIQWLKVGVPIFTRHSDVEPDPALYDSAVGIWLDGFHGDWWDGSVIERHLDAGKRVCIVSPELHHRDHRAAWERLASEGLPNDGTMMICTDLPEEAREYFGNDH
jgi:hypothetical protein